MRTYVILLRGINVLGKRTLPMKELTAILESLGCRNVRTNIQSGNAVFQRGSAIYLHAPDGIGRSKLAAKIERHLGVAATARNWRTVDALLQLSE